MLQGYSGIKPPPYITPLQTLSAVSETRGQVVQISNRPDFPPSLTGQAAVWASG